VLGIGGGGDVVGALATAETCRLQNGADPVVGGVAWERLAIDPEPGPRGVAEIAGAVGTLAEGVLLAGPETRIAASAIPFAEARMARHLGRATVLVDILGGPAAVARGLRAAAARLEADLLVFVDVGGDALAHGDERGLGSPLCDAVVLAAAAALADEPAPPVLGAVFGPGCDGELTLSEVGERLAEVGAGGGLAGARGLGPAVAATLERAVDVVPTEASAQALRCFRGERGHAPIRGGERQVPLTPAGAGTVYFDVRVALATAARLAAAVREAATLEDANQALRTLGVRSELDRERERAGAPERPNAFDREG
jgi:hypothetical protein